METPINYKPYNERLPDRQYHDLLEKIVKNGRKLRPIHARLPENANTEHKYSLELTGQVLQYDMSNGFPLMNIRDLRKSFKGALGEVIGFLRGAQTLEELKDAGCPNIFWERWVPKEKCEIFGLPEHDLGPGSYGAILRRMPFPGGSFDQVQALTKQMKERPFLRTHMITTWYPPFAMGDITQNAPRKVVVAPCHGNEIHFVLFDEEKELELVLYQRSADVPVGLVLNIAEWAAFGMMAAHILGYKFTKYTHMMSEPHIYDIQLEAVEELLKREPRRLPTIHLNPGRKVENFWDFKPEDFRIDDDYDPHENMQIPTPI